MSIVVLTPLSLSLSLSASNGNVGADSVQPGLLVPQAEVCCLLMGDAGTDAHRLANKSLKRCSQKIRPSDPLFPERLEIVSKKCTPSSFLLRCAHRSCQTLIVRCFCAVIDPGSAWVHLPHEGKLGGGYRVVPCGKSCLTCYFVDGFPTHVLTYLATFRHWRTIPRTRLRVK